MLTTFINALLSADAVCGASYRTVTEERTNRRNGLPAPGLRHPHQHDRCRDLEAAPRQLPPRRLHPPDDAANALTMKVREGGRVVNCHVYVATGVNADGYREILGLQVFSVEDGAGWLSFFRDLAARGLTGVKLITSDAHQRLPPRAPLLRVTTGFSVRLMNGRGSG